MDRHTNKDRSPFKGSHMEPSTRKGKGTERNNVLTYKKLRKMPLNLRKQAVREARNRNEPILGKKKKRKTNPRFFRTARRLRNDFDRSEHKAMLASTSEELRRILQDVETLSDIPHDITNTELQGEVIPSSTRGVKLQAYNNFYLRMYWLSS